MNRDLGEGGSRTPRQERPPGERGRARIGASGNHVKGAHDRSDRQHPSQESKSTRAVTHVRGAHDRSDRRISISREQEHASNDVRSQDAEHCEESDARYVLSVTFAETTSSVILMT